MPSKCADCDFLDINDIWNKCPQCGGQSWDEYQNGLVDSE